MSTGARDFHIGTILSITDGHLLAPNKIGDVYEILNFMTGDELFTHQLPRAGRECAPYLLQQHPQLADFDGSDITTENYLARLEKAKQQFGEFLQVQPIPLEAHRVIDPIQEAQDMVGADKVIVVVTT